MGSTRVIYTDATTAEAASALKTCGFTESHEGGLYTSPGNPVKAYVVWGKSSYYPDLVARLDFSPRIQIHLKCRDNGADLTEVAVGAVSSLRGICPETRIRLFNADACEEMEC